MTREDAEFDLAASTSGTRGIVSGKRLLAAAATDAWIDLRMRVSGTSARLHRDARKVPPRKVLALCAYRDRRATTVARAIRELRTSRHEVAVRLGAVEEGASSLVGDTVARRLRRGKFRNLNALLGDRCPAGFDHVIVLDDDVGLPRHFLDRIVLLAERFDLGLCQPALTRASHGAWDVCRRAPGSIVRETRFVEIGPVTLFRGRALSEFLPFPDLDMAWGLDLHWAAVARQSGIRLGIVDAEAVSHRLDPPAAAYDQAGALQEMATFLACRPHITAAEAREVVATHARW